MFSRKIALLFTIALPAAAAAQSSSIIQTQASVSATSIVAARAKATIQIDGVLNESVWRAAPSATAFVQREPVEGAAASRPSDVRMLITDDAVIIGAHFTDEAITTAHAATAADRKSAAFAGDYFEVQIDAHASHLTALAFAVSPTGDKRSWMVAKDGTRDESWAVEWQAAAHADKQGWTVEIRVPLSELHASPGAEQWGVQFVRFSAARQETDVLSSAPARSSATADRQ